MKPAIAWKPPMPGPSACAAPASSAPANRFSTRTALSSRCFCNSAFAAGTERCANRAPLRHASWGRQCRAQVSIHCLTELRRRRECAGSGNEPSSGSRARPRGRSLAGHVDRTCSCCTRAPAVRAAHLVSHRRPTSRRSLGFDVSRPSRAGRRLCSSECVSRRRRVHRPRQLPFVTFSTLIARKSANFDRAAFRADDADRSAPCRRSCRRTASLSRGRRSSARRSFAAPAAVLEARPIDRHTVVSERLVHFHAECAGPCRGRPRRCRSRTVSACRSRSNDDELVELDRDGSWISEPSGWLRIAVPTSDLPAPTHSRETSGSMTTADGPA